MLTTNKTLLSNGISIQPPSTAEVDLLLVQDCNPNTGHCLNSCIRQTYNPCVSSPYRLPIMVLGSRIVTFNAEILSDKSLQSHCDEIIIVNSHAIIECDNARIYMSHFAYACKMRCLLNLVLENSEYLWFYWTFCIVILDNGLKLHKLSNHTLVILQKWLEIH